MRIAGFVKNSFLDYPGHIAAVVFVPGCNMDCWYCHNRSLWKESTLIHPAEVEAYLKKRRGFLDGVVISGGEPTLQKALPDFIARLREFGYKVKLDTNGLRPEVVASLIGMLDYVALDLKAPPGGYKTSVVSFDIDEASIWRTARLLMDSGIEYEFRTTFTPLLSVEDAAAIARTVRGAKRYVLQQYRPTGNADRQPHSAQTIKKAAEAAREFIDNVTIRGL